MRIDLYKTPGIALGIVLLLISSSCRHWEFEGNDEQIDPSADVDNLVEIHIIPYEETGLPVRSLEMEFIPPVINYSTLTIEKPAYLKGKNGSITLDLKLSQGVYAKKDKTNLNRLINDIVDLNMTLSFPELIGFAKYPKMYKKKIPKKVEGKPEYLAVSGCEYEKGNDSAPGEFLYSASCTDDEGSEYVFNTYAEISNRYKKLLSDADSETPTSEAKQTIETLSDIAYFASSFAIPHVGVPGLGMVDDFDKPVQITRRSVRGQPWRRPPVTQPNNPGRMATVTRIGTRMRQTPQGRALTNLADVTRMQEGPKAQECRALITEYRDAIMQKLRIKAEEAQLTVPESLGDEIYEWMLNGNSMLDFSPGTNHRALAEVLENVVMNSVPPVSAIIERLTRLNVIKADDAYFFKIMLKRSSRQSITQDMANSDLLQLSSLRNHIHDLRGHPHLNIIENGNMAERAASTPLNFSIHRLSPQDKHLFDENIAKWVREDQTNLKLIRSSRATRKSSGKKINDTAETFVSEFKQAVVDADIIPEAEAGKLDFLKYDLAEWVNKGNKSSEFDMLKAVDKRSGSIPEIAASFRQNQGTVENIFILVWHEFVQPDPQTLVERLYRFGVISLEQYNDLAANLDRVHPLFDKLDSTRIEIHRLALKEYPHLEDIVPASQKIRQVIQINHQKRFPNTWLAKVIKELNVNTTYERMTNRLANNVYTQSQYSRTPDQVLHAMQKIAKSGKKVPEEMLELWLYKIFNNAG
ncbi:MAG: hypothetical protein JXA66_01200 [Oligoflexia bacterium]|nr:hypothetical protein [Oligoflexia bacterium]